MVPNSYNLSLMTSFSVIWSSGSHMQPFFHNWLCSWFFKTIAKVISLFKKGDLIQIPYSRFEATIRYLSNLGNYRPISLLSMLSKIIWENTHVPVCVFFFSQIFCTLPVPVLSLASDNTTQPRSLALIELLWYQTWCS